MDMNKISEIIKDISELRCEMCGASNERMEEIKDELESLGRELLSASIGA